MYQLLMRVRRDIRVRVGALGWRALAPGWYVYTGRAARGLAARLARHRRRRKKRHWHIDYLLGHRAVELVGAWLADADPSAECRVHQTTLARPDAALACPGFGASDCRSGCGSHLVRMPAYHPSREATAENGP